MHTPTVNWLVERAYFNATHRRDGVTELQFCSSGAAVAWCSVGGLGISGWGGCAVRGRERAWQGVFGLVVRGGGLGFCSWVGLILGLLSMEWCVER